MNRHADFHASQPPKWIVDFLRESKDVHAKLVKSTKPPAFTVQKEKVRVESSKSLLREKIEEVRSFRKSTCSPFDESDQFFVDCLESVHELEASSAPVAILKSEDVFTNKEILFPTGGESFVSISRDSVSDVDGSTKAVEASTGAQSADIEDLSDHKTSNGGEESECYDDLKSESNALELNFHEIYMQSISDFSGENFTSNDVPGNDSLNDSDGAFDLPVPLRRTIQQNRTSDIEEKVSIATVPDVNSANELPQYSVSDIVEARFMRGGKWFPGTINAVNVDGTYDIVYVNGDKERNITSEYIRLISIEIPQSPESDKAKSSITISEKSSSGRASFRLSHPDIVESEKKRTSSKGTKTSINVSDSVSESMIPKTNDDDEEAYLKSRNLFVTLTRGATSAKKKPLRSSAVDDAGEAEQLK